jgi:uncharacterized damage-inducible protein DinB
LVNLKARLSALALVGVARGIGLAVGAGGDWVGVGVAVAALGEHCAVGFESAQLVRTKVKARTAANWRFFPSLFEGGGSCWAALLAYDAAVAMEGGLADEVARGYEVHQGRLVKMIAPLDQAQLDLAAAPHLWSVRTLACHIVAARAWWMHSWMGEGSAEFGAMTDWDEDEALATRSASEIVGGLEESFAVIKLGLERWLAAELAEEFIRPRPNEAGERPKHSRQWIIWHLVEHDVHHGGEISFSLGMHGVPGLDL